MSSIYFPLRSNVHYWDLEPLDLDLESRLKLSTILYDELVFDPGIYVASIGPELSIEVKGPYSQDLPPLLFEQAVPREGGEFSFKFNTLELNSVAVATYQLCFEKLLAEIGLDSATWISFNQNDFTDEVKQTIAKIVEEDLDYLYTGHQHDYMLQKRALSSVNHDWAMAWVNNWNLNLDPLHETYWRQRLAGTSNTHLIQSAPIELELVFPKLPQLSEVSWDEILRIRDSHDAAQFRQQVSNLTIETQQAFVLEGGANALRYRLQEIRDEQLLDIIESNLTKRSKALRRIAVSLIFSVGSALPLIGQLIALSDVARDSLSPLIELKKQEKTLGAAFIRKRYE